MLDHLMSVKAVNQRRVLNLLRAEPGISRVEIAGRTGLGKATISSIISDFIAQGLVREDGVAEQTSVGRHPVRLRLNTLAGLAVGVELTGSECIAALTDLCAEPLRVIRYPTPNMSADVVVSLIAQSVHTLLDGYDASKLLGVGVGVPGQVDLARQRVIKAINIGWFDVPLGLMLTERLNTPVTVVKRQNAGVLGEYWYGIGKGQANLIFVSIGVGIGCGIILRGELYEGTDGSAGELGHIMIVPEGRRCRCGNYGCLETVASCPAIAIRAKEEARTGRRSLLVDWSAGILESITIGQVIQAANHGDSLAIELIAEAARYLGLALACVINLLNPSMVIIGGEVLEAGSSFIDNVRREAQRHACSPLAKTGDYRNQATAVNIVPTSLGYRGPSIGAAALISNRFFALSGAEGV
jgi:N-acetylglucosamine repressor